MKHFLFILVMICASTLPVMAGAIPTDGSPAPTPPGSNQTVTATALGEIPSVGKMSQAALSALLSALGLASI